MPCTKRALDLAAIDAGVQRVADVVEDVDAQHALHPGEPSTSTSVTAAPYAK